MSLTLDQVRHIAKLARLELAPGDAEAVQAKLNGILDLLEQMQTADTDGIEPMSHPQAEAQRLRHDEATEPDLRTIYQALAPQTENGLYLVPKVIE
ncbi:Asp-tRNA(Asn)/Glu-tRNA(Gln) amidotransferase subunit GatC [Zoogloea sp.]|uniref:Asp-tRNA(Asn)/Glu-tRNA(Gln) amidotransferase subunit GatC n=1 Tax=Zoogloea sp. TaxID=49181 RepID=UPI0035B0D6E5